MHMKPLLISSTLALIIGFVGGRLSSEFSQHSESSFKNERELKSGNSSDGHSKKSFFIKHSEAKADSSAKKNDESSLVQEKSVEDSTSVKNSGIDYFKSLDQLEKFDKMMNAQLNEKFVVLDLNSKNNFLQRSSLHGRLEAFHEDKQYWYVTQLSPRDSQSPKAIIYYNVYSCDEQLVKKNGDFKKLAEICYKLIIFSPENGKLQEWNQYGMISFIAWNNDRPYLKLSVYELRDLARKLDAAQVIIPYPTEESGESFSLIYRGNKFSWDSLGEVSWERSSEKAMLKLRNKILQSA